MTWLSNYTYRKKGAVNATTAGAQTLYQLKLIVGESSGASGEDIDCENYCLDFPNDIRFTKEDGITKHDYWVDISSLEGTTPNRKVSVWIEVASIPASGSVDFYMYYHKSSDSGESNGDTTFPDFFDDFLGTSLDTNKWSVANISGVPSASYNYFALSSPTVLFTGGASKSYHTFQPVHETDIQEVDMGGYTYWAYHTLAGGAPFEVHLARSNSLTSGWVDYGKVFDGRWPSVTDQGGTFHMFYQDAGGAATIKRATSTDGINWTYQEDICSGNNPYLWKNPNDSKWYLFYHDTGGSGHRIRVRNATNLEDLDSALDVTLIDQSAVIASPAVHYYDGKYWLLCETYPLSVWNTVAYWSESIDSGYLECCGNPILSNQDACGMPMKKGSTLYFYYNELTDVPNDYWDIVVRTSDFSGASSCVFIDGSSYSVNDSQLHFSYSGGGNNPVINTVNKYNTGDKVFEAKWRLDSITGQAVGFHLRSAFSGNAYLSYLLASSTPAHSDSYIDTNADGAYEDSNNWLSWAISTWYDTIHRLKSGETKWERDGTTHTYAGSFTQNVYILLGYYEAALSVPGDVFNSDWDWVLVRKYASPEPTWGSWGDAEAQLISAETGSGADALSQLSATLLNSDLGAGADTLSGLLAILLKTDSGAGVDSLISLLAAISQSDTGSGIESLGSRRFGAADQGAGADISELIVTILKSDQGAGADALAELLATVVKSDQGVGAEVLGAQLFCELLATVAKSDQGVGAESLGSRRFGAADQGAGVDISELIATILKTESGTGADALSELIATILKTESGAGADALSVLLGIITQSDEGSGIGSVGSRALGAAEIGSGTETLSQLLATLTCSDSGVGTEFTLWVVTFVLLKLLHERQVNIMALQDNRPVNITLSQEVITT